MVICSCCALSAFLEHGSYHGEVSIKSLGSSEQGGRMAYLGGDSSLGISHLIDFLSGVREHV